jgi:hypothetical protein
MRGARVWSVITVLHAALHICTRRLCPRDQRDLTSHLNRPFLVIDLLRKPSKLKELGESPMFQLNKADI